MLADISDIGNFSDLIDTRSPAEFVNDHIPGAVNLPVLDDAEHAAVGAMYNQDAFSARRTGAALIARRIADYLQNTLADKSPDWMPLVYCARGGQRSNSMVAILRRVGWRAHQLNGGYKAYRQHVIATLDTRVGNLPWVVIAGKTGIGKTDLLAVLGKQGAQIVDLEALATHRGSVFGGLGAQPSQRRFESRLYAAIAPLDASLPIFVESESRKIGSVYLPSPLLAAIRNATAVRLDATQQHRVQYTLNAYHNDNFETFVASARRLTPYVGKKTVCHWQTLFETQQHPALIAELLDFYDLSYNRSLQKNYPTAFLSPTLMINPTDEKSLHDVAQTLRHQFANIAATPRQPVVL